MKLINLFETNSNEIVDQSLRDVEDYTTQFLWKPTTDNSIENLIKIFPPLSFEGPIYRAFAFNKQNIQNGFDLRLLLSDLHQFDQKNNRKYFAWSKTLEGMVTALGNTHANFEQIPFWIANQSNSKGLDVNKLSNAITIHDIDEHEVLAPLTNNIHIFGFLFNSYFYPYDEANKFLKDIRLHY